MLVVSGEWLVVFVVLVGWVGLEDSADPTPPARDLELRPNVGPEDVPLRPTAATWLAVGLFGLVGVLSLTLGWRAIARRRQLPALSARDEALKKLAQIRPELLNGQVSHDNAYSLLSEAVRDFLYAGLHIGLPQQSTPEIVASINGTDRLLDNQKHQVADLLNRCDEVRFGRSPASPEETAAWLATAKLIVEEVGRISIRPIKTERIEIRSTR